MREGDGRNKANDYRKINHIRSELLLFVNESINKLSSNLKVNSKTSIEIAQRYNEINIEISHPIIGRCSKEDNDDLKSFQAPEPLSLALINANFSRTSSRKTTKSTTITEEEIEETIKLFDNQQEHNYILSQAGFNQIRAISSLVKSKEVIIRKERERKYSSIELLQKFFDDKNISQKMMHSNSNNNSINRRKKSSNTELPIRRREAVNLVNA